MPTPDAMLTLAAEPADAQAHGDAESLAVIARQLHGEAAEDLAYIGQLRAAVHAARSRPRNGITNSNCRLSGTAGLRAQPRRRATSQRADSNGDSESR